jgi:hypothetical protein
MKRNRKALTVLVLFLGLAFAISACDPDPGYLDVEETYSDAGPFSTTSQSVTGFTIFYPGNLEGNHPIITWGNGTSAATMVYRPLLNHLASWGNELLVP